MNTQVAAGQPLVGRTAMLEVLRGLFRAFPDSYTHPVNLFEDGEWAILETDRYDIVTIAAVANDIPTLLLSLLAAPRARRPCDRGLTGPGRSMTAAFRSLPSAVGRGAPEDARRSPVRRDL